MNNETKWANGIYQNLKSVNGKNVVETRVKVQEFIASLLEHQDKKGEVWISAWPKKNDDGKGTLVPIINDWRPTPKAESVIEDAQVVVSDTDDDYDLPF